MGFRFYRRVKIAPGISLNLSKSGGSLSFGPRGAKFTVGPCGKRVTVGLPGTGLYYTTTLGSRKKSRSSSGRRGTSRNHPPQTADRGMPPGQRLTLGFFQRLVTPDDEEALVDGCRELVLGREDEAFASLRRAAHQPDGAFLAGFLALKKEQFEEAVAYLTAAAEGHRKLGSLFAKYGVTVTMKLSITDEVTAHVEPGLRGALLGLAEAQQRLQRWTQAKETLEQLHQLDPDDVVVRLSLAELLLDLQESTEDAVAERRTQDAIRSPVLRSSVSGEEPGAVMSPLARQELCHRVVQLGEGVENESEIHTALLLCRARALRKLGLANAACEVLTAALRRKKDRSGELLRALRYERALAYHEMGSHRRARSDLEKIYAEAPDYEDVAERLGLTREREL